MKALSITFGASVLACSTGPCATSTQTSYTPPLSFGASFSGHGNSFSGPSRVVDVSYSPFSANKPWQQNSGASVPSNWQNSPSSVWTPSQAVQQARVPTTPRPPNPTLAGRPPSEQLQITKCRSGQSCEKCRQLNCFWDSTAKITSRCIALGLEQSQIPIEAGQASNLGYCPTSGQQGFTGVNWLAIENSGAAVPNLEGMSDAGVQQWLSSIPNYDPDATDSNYPAGVAFSELLPTTAKAYAQGSIPSTTPWITFFDSLSGGYSYEYLDSSYTYDSPADYISGSLYSNFGGSEFEGASAFGGLSNPFGPSDFGSSSVFAPAPSFSASSDLGASWNSPFPSQPFNSIYPSTTSFSGSLPLSPSFGPLPAAPACCGHQFDVPFSGVSQPLGSPFPPLAGSPFPPLPGSPLGFAPLPSSPLGFGGSFPSSPVGFGQPLAQPAWSGSF